MNNEKGFSLVEMIVVGVLIAVMASIGIPLYSGYIRDQRQSTVNNLAETSAAAANSYWRRTNATLTNTDFLPNSTTLSLYYRNSSYSITVSGNNITVTDLKRTAITNTANYR